MDGPPLVKVYRELTDPEDRYDPLERLITPRISSPYNLHASTNCNVKTTSRVPTLKLCRFPCLNPGRSKIEDSFQSFTM